MKRLIFATVAALALAACSDTSPVIDTHKSPSQPNRTIFYGPVQTIFTSETPASTIDATGGWEVSTRFSVFADGKISGFRFWKAVGETGTHTARLNTNVKQVKTFGFFGSISHDDLYADLSYYGQPTGSFPTSSSGSIYFVDVDFRPYVCNTLIDNPCPP